MTRFARIAPAALCLLLAACSTIEQGTKIDYRSATKGPALEVPPDLTQLARDTRYALPGTGPVSASSQAQAARPVGAPTAAAALGDVRIERAGSQRWLVVNRPADQLWSPIQEFWKENGFVLVTDQPALGIMETDWAENRAKIPEDILRRTLGKLFDRLYDTGERDKFRTRLDSINGQQTEIVISHRGLVEIATTSNSSDAKTTWTNRPPDRELEAEFLRRMMLRLGADQNRAQALLAQAATTAPKAQIVRTPQQSSIEIAESFDRAWRRVGVAIDRLGFTVEDRDRAKGLFFVRYRDPTVEEKREEKGFFSKLFSSDKPSEAAEQYRILVSANGDQGARVSVLNKAGQPTNDTYAQRMLSVLFEQLK